MITATREIGRHWRQILLRAYVEHQIHADRYVKEKMAMEEPNAGIAGTEPQHCVTVIRHSDCVLECWFGEIALQHAQAIQIQSVFQVDLFNGIVRWTSQADNIKRRAMQMEWMTQIGLLHFVDEHDLDHSA